MEKETNLFKQWIESIPVGEYKDIRYRVIRECYITDQIFRHWRIGSVKVPPLAQKEINKIAGREIFKIEHNAT